jgi:HlyD family secretion protein
MTVKKAIFICIISLTGCSKPSDHKAQGYVEGRYTYIASNVSGTLTKLLVDRGSQVKRGDVLFELEEQPESDSLNEAEENLKQLINAREAKAANLVYAKVTYERYQDLVKQKAIQQSQLDNAKATYVAMQADLAGADATIASARALLKRVKWTKDQKRKTAPVDAQVFDTYYRIGEYTVANQPVLSLLAPDDIRVIFYVEEAKLSRLKMGSAISLECDGCEKKIPGKIRFISPSAEYTPPVIYSNETNYKFIYRIEADFSPADAKRLHPGQPVTVNYQVA